MSTLHRFVVAGAALLASASFAFAADAVKPFAAPPAAVPAALPWDAFVSIGVGQLDAGSAGGTLPRQTVRGSASTMMAPNWGTQFDVLGDFVTATGSSIGAIDAAGHLYFRSSAGLLGAFAQYRHLAAGTGDVPAWFGGAEGQRYFMKSSVDAQVAFQSFSASGSTDNGWLANAAWNYFFHPNFKAGLTVGYDSLNAGGGGSGLINTAYLGISSEVRFNGPLSLFAKYEFEDVSEAGSSVSVNNFLIGGKWNVGSTTLWQRETTGASLDPVGGILAFIR